MILGVSHIVLGSTAVGEDARFLGQLGYTPTFIAYSIPTAPQKRKYMIGHSNAQAIAYCRPEDGISIELIQYDDQLFPGPSPCHLVFPVLRRADLPEMSPAPLLARAWAASGRGTLKAAQADRFATALYWSESSGPSQLLMEVPDLDAARRLFESGFQFRTTDRGLGWCVCVRRSLVRQWEASLLLVENSSAPVLASLDSAGFRCLSFLSSDLAVDRTEILKAGVLSSTGVFGLTVNAKPLQLEMFEGPRGLVVEVLQVDKLRVP